MLAHDRNARHRLLAACCSNNRVVTPFAAFCAAGSRQLFLGDVQSGIKKFSALFGFLSQQVVLSPNRQHLDELPAQARETLLAVVAAYTPYYTPPAVRPGGYATHRDKVVTPI
jgi:hypothetical protein